MRAWKLPTALGNVASIAKHVHNGWYRPVSTRQRSTWLQTALPFRHPRRLAHFLYPHDTDTTVDEKDPLKKSNKRVAPYTPKAGRRPKTKIKKVSERTAEELEEQLFWLANNAPATSSRQIEEIFAELTTGRGVTATSAHYEARILQNCDPHIVSDGGRRSAVEARIKNVLAAMQAEGVAVTASVYQAILMVLAVHPSPRFQQEIIAAMTAQWMSISAESEHAIIASLIRDGQLELAQARLATLAHQPPEWLYVLLVYALCEARDFDAVLQLAYSLADDRRWRQQQQQQQQKQKQYRQQLDLPRLTWSHVLTQAVCHGAFDLTLHMWLHHVEPMYIRPSYETCTGAVALGAAHKSPKLAESAMAVVESVYCSRQRSDADDDTSTALCSWTERQRLESVVAAAYADEGDAGRDAKRYRRGNLFPLFAGRHEPAFYDPKVALASKPRLPRGFVRRMAAAGQRRD